MERREVLSGTGVIPFATLAGHISTAGQPTQVVLHLAADQVTSNRSKPVLIGFFAQPTAGSTVNPAITEVDGPRGQLAPLALPPRPKSPQPPSIFLTQILPIAGQAQDIKVNVAGVAGTVGDVIVEAFLPGDVNGTHTIDASDLAGVNASYGAVSGQANFNSAADFNGDGHVGHIDRRLTQLNQGASVASFPVTTSAVVPAPPVVPPVAPPAAPVAPPAAPVAPAPVPVATATVTAVPVVVSTVQAAPVAVATTTQATPTYAIPTTVATPTTVTVPTTQTATVAYVPAAASGAAYAIGQPVVQAPSIAYGQPAPSGVTYLVAQPAAPGAMVPAGSAPSIAYGQPAPSGVTYLVAQPAAPGAMVPAGSAPTSPGPIYWVYPPTNQAPTSVVSPATVAAPVPVVAPSPVTTLAYPTATAPISVATSIPAAATAPISVATSIPAATTVPTTVAIPGLTNFQQASAPVYYYGQSVVQTPPVGQVRII